MADHSQQLLHALRQVQDYTHLMQALQEPTETPSEAREVATQAVTDMCSELKAGDPAQAILNHIDNAFLCGEITLAIAEEAEAFLLEFLEDYR